MMDLLKLDAKVFEIWYQKACINNIRFGDAL